MAQCPNCGRHLKLIDWRPQCPGCGVNMVYFKSNERLLAESEKAEIAHAKFQPGVDRAKASFLGSKAAIMRIPLSLLPLAGLMLPTVKKAGGNMNIIDIVKVLSSGDIKAYMLSAFSGRLPALSLVFAALSVVMILVSLGCSVMSLVRHGKMRNLLLNGSSVLLALISAVILCFSVSDDGQKLSIGIGAVIYILLLILLTAYNYILVDKGILKVKYTVCYIGGLPSDRYFDMVERGCSELEIRREMVKALTRMQNEVRQKAEAAQQEALKRRLERK